MSLSCSKKLSFFGVVTFLTIAVIFNLCNVAHSAPLSIGTNPQGSVAYAVGAAVANISSEEAGLQMRVVPQGGPPVTIPMVNKGRLEFSIANGLVATAAHNGTITFKDRPQEKVQVLCYLFPLYLGYIVQKDSNIKSIADLKGKRVPSNYTKQKNVGVFAKGSLVAAGLSWDDVKGIPVPSGARGVDDFVSGAADTAYFSLTSGKILQANASVKGIRVLSLPDSPEADNIIKKEIPGSFITVFEPGSVKNIPGILQRTRVLSQPFLVMVNADLEPEKAYKIVKALYNSKEKMVSMHKAFNNFDPTAMYLNIDVPYHPGAVNFFKEAGLKQN